MINVIVTFHLYRARFKQCPEIFNDGGYKAVANERWALLAGEIVR